MAQSLLDAKEQACQGGAELQQIEAKLQKASEEDAHLKASLLYPFLLVPHTGPQPLLGGVKSFPLETKFGARSPGPPGAGLACGLPPSKVGSLTACPTQLTRELEDLKEVEADLEKQEKEVDDDTTVTIPAAM